MEPLSSASIGLQTGESKSDQFGIFFLRRHMLMY